MNRLSTHALVSYQTQKITDQGEVIKVIHPNKEWRVRFQATDWTARSTSAIVLRPGDQVRVVGIENISLWIEPIS
jgi:membrane protein implicated in regulation of membrane protease activity